jgi:maltose O-acetyltransferase
MSRSAGRNTWVVGFKVSTVAELKVGNRTDINYQTYISVARRVVIGDDVMIASNVEIHDNPSHPLDPGRRKRRESFDLDEAAPVVIGHNVWIAGGAKILQGVTIGDNSVVAAGAVVTASVPCDVLVAGVPARVIRQLGAP